MTKSQLEDLCNKVNSTPLNWDVSYAEYVDNNDPSKGVNLCDKNGCPRVWMPTETYLELRKGEL